jgi:hypothetical protein
MAASSPPPMHGATRNESRESYANNRNIDGDRWVDGMEGGVDGTPDGTPDGMPAGVQNGTPGGVKNGVNGATNGSTTEE